MADLKVTVKVMPGNRGERDPLGQGLKNRIQKFLDGEEKARKEAAVNATRLSRRIIRSSYKRPTAPARVGRSSTGGKLAERLQWKASKDQALVELNYSELDRRAPHWIIQEIGTGQRATVKRAGKRNPQGRPQRDSGYVRTVRRQRGRLISSGLAFGTGPSGAYQPPGSAAGQQLYPIQNLSGRPPLQQRRRPIVISREIEGKHFVRDGGVQGFREYRSSVRAAARSAFERR